MLQRTLAEFTSLEDYYDTLRLQPVTLRDRFVASLVENSISVTKM